MHSSARVSKTLKKISKAIKSKGITSIPSTTSLANSLTLTTTGVGLSPNVGVETVSGTPPMLVSLPNFDAKNVFWLPGVVDAIANASVGSLPSQEVCDQFFASSVDGQSGGLGACQTVESVGRSFQTLIATETSICFLRNLPTKANEQAGGIVKTKGKYPGNDITRLFAPGGKARVVKVNVVTPGVGSRSVFVKIASKDSNTKKKLLFSADLYFCQPDQTDAAGFNTIRISEQGKLTLKLANKSDPFTPGGGGGSNIVTVTGFLTFLDNAINWDPSKTRTVEVNEVRNNEKFKTTFTIDSSNQIVQKVRRDFDTTIDRNMNIAHFSGTDIRNLSILEDAFNSLNLRDSTVNSFLGAAEYRDTFYAAAPSNALLSSVSGDLNADSFFTDPAEADVDPSKYKCSATPDIEITLVPGNTAVNQVLSTCVTTDFDQIEICRNNSTITQARINHGLFCNGPGGGGPGAGGPGGGN